MRSEKSKWHENKNCVYLEKSSQRKIEQKERKKNARIE